MSSGTSPFASKAELKELKKQVHNIAVNSGAEFGNLRTQSISIAVCFDTLLQVIDEAMPGTADKLKEKLKAKSEKKPDQRTTT